MTQIFCWLLMMDTVITRVTKNLILYSRHTDCWNESIVTNMHKNIRMRSKMFYLIDNTDSYVK